MSGSLAMATNGIPEVTWDPEVNLSGDDDDDGGS